LADLITIAMPVCASAQLFSNTLPSTSVRRALFNSNRFLTVHTPFHDGFLKKWFRRMVMSEGTRFGIPGSLPPNMMFSPAASR
jgi:hypothetical protein